MASLTTSLLHVLRQERAQGGKVSKLKHQAPRTWHTKRVIFIRADPRFRVGNGLGKDSGRNAPDPPSQHQQCLVACVRLFGQGVRQVQVARAKAEVTANEKIGTLSWRRHEAETNRQENRAQDTGAGPRNGWASGP